MAFTWGFCAEEVLVEIGLPEDLRLSKSGETDGRYLLHDVDRRSALMPHPYHYSDYPDRSLSLYVAGVHYPASEFIRWADRPDRAEIWFKKGTSTSESRRIVNIFEEALAVLREESRCSLPIVVRYETR